MAFQSRVRSERLARNDAEQSVAKDALERSSRMQLAALDTAQRVEDMNIPGFRLHSLKGRERGRWSIWVSGNWRLTFEFRDRDAYVLDYEDYH
ncbi:MAG: hypothetical protein A3G80_07325 [Betaproteobacteria bacterium RIFCSPLOWO2_12_FULL_62_13b]|nr:MAG: hypothetical protein A3G80_07325 [Betaproteobacteria bacterium RIFCSPLOWO2_12_FULL_62_13b]